MLHLQASEVATVQVLRRDLEAITLKEGFSMVPVSGAMYKKDAYTVNG